MVNGELLAKLQRRAQEACIRQIPQSYPWLEDHKATFQAIERLHATTSESYVTEVAIRPWKRHDLEIADHLVSRSTDLNKRAAKESEWRLNIEHLIVWRLSVEVACQQCNNRLKTLEVKRREPAVGFGNSLNCACPLNGRSSDRYEIRTNNLFSDRAEHAFYTKDSNAGLPNLRPDRTCGLRETGTIRDFFDQPQRAPENSRVQSIRDLLETSPFKQHPLHFPFLVIEAKSGTAQESFADIQTQTALPLQQLLNLQSSLWKYRMSDASGPAPLVWFLAYKGSDWKIYACYMSEGERSRSNYHIQHLQGGDMTTRDGALQLTLILNYIVDWARDYYRPAVLAQLNSLATGKPFKESHVDPDQDAESTPASWYSRAPDGTRPNSATEGADNVSARNSEPSDNDLLPPPRCEFGLVQPMKVAMFRCIGLRLTKCNVDKFLSSNDGGTASAACARDILHQITRWHDMLVATAAGLDALEFIWSGKSDPRPTSADDGQDTQFYVVLQYRCYVDLAWTIVRELNYLAVSKSALPALMKLAATQRKIPGLYSLDERVRPCPDDVLQSTVDCLRSGSPWQVLCSALASTLLYLHPGPERIEDRYAPPVSYLMLGYTRTVHFSAFLHRLAKPSSTFKFGKGRRTSGTGPQRYRRDDPENTFWRVSKKKTRLDNVSHDRSSCSRCLLSDQDYLELRFWGPTNESTHSLYGAILVSSLKEEDVSTQPQIRHELCLFLLPEYSELSGNPEYWAVVEDLGRHGACIYHTICHGPFLEDLGSNALLWNLPWPYRHSTNAQRYDIERWANELDEDALPEDGPKVTMHLWVAQQILLHYLHQGKTYREAQRAMVAFRDEARAAYRRQNGLSTTEDDLPLACVRLSEFWDQAHRYLRAHGEESDSYDL